MYVFRLLEEAKNSFGLWDNLTENWVKVLFPYYYWESLDGVHHKDLFYVVVAVGLKEIKHRIETI